MLVEEHLLTSSAGSLPYDAITRFVTYSPVGLRVLIIVENLPVPLDRRVWQESCALRDAGYEVSVICPRMSGFTEPEEMLEGIRIFRHPIAAEARGMRHYLSEYGSALWGELRCALKLWRSRGFDVIHLCNPPDLLFLVALPFKWFGGVKIIFDVHDLCPEMFAAKFQQGRFAGLIHRAVLLAERCTLAVADAVMATNESVRQAVHQRSRWAKEDIFIVRTAPRQIDTSAPADPLLRKGRTYLVGYVGVMGSADGVHYLLQAAAHIIQRRSRRDVQFLLMGKGPEYQALLAERDQLGLQDYVDMPGRVSQAFLETGLQTMDLGVACDPINDYNDHCTMNKTLEYMAFGKPQVMFATREGRYSAQDAAVYVMENSADQLGDAILDTLDDPERRRCLGERGRQRLENEIGWDQSVKQLLAAYEKALKA